MAMILHITEVTYVSDYKLRVTFNNGKSGVADLSGLVEQGVFKVLAAQDTFAQVGLDAELATVVWPGGLDVAPEFVYFHAFKDAPEHQQQFQTWGYVGDALR